MDELFCISSDFGYQLLFSLGEEHIQNWLEELAVTPGELYFLEDYRGNINYWEFIC